MQCAALLLTNCPACGTLSLPGAKFCDTCSAALFDAAPATTPGAAAIGISDIGERRHLTVLFCDLVNSTKIAAQLDPEEWREVVAGYHHATTRVIERFGGYVAQYLGDGIMAYFGWPQAYGDDAERAVRAGLAIIEDIPKLNGPTTGPQLSARVGIDSGLVVVGMGGGKAIDVFGKTPNIAARLQTTAAPNTVLITAATLRLLSGLFVVEQRGAQALKGIARPLQLYRVVQASGVRGRLKALAASRGLTPFIGREHELRWLSELWERVRKGEGHVALIMGEPGIGKSRLIQRFHEEITTTPHTWVEAAASPFFQNTPLYPVSENLRKVLSWRGDESLEEQLAQLESALVLAGLNPPEAIPLLAPLLNIGLPAKYRPLPLSSEQQRRRLLALMVEWVIGLARVQPTVIVTEDLHWADPSTLELIQLLIEQGLPPQLLLLYTARPEFRASWTLQGRHRQITLNQLSVRNARIMVEQLTAGQRLAEETIAAVVERTGGVPLFVEELTRAVLDRGDDGLIKRAIPVSLNDSLMARLDRLGPAKEVAQVGAVIGSEFSYELIHAVHPISEEHLQRALRNLTEAELLYAHGAAPHATYLFKHALIRDAAYEALLKSQRKDLHRLVARTIDQKFPALKGEHPELLAYHWTEAGEIELAIAEWSRAGMGAESRNAFREATESYKQAIRLVDTLPKSPLRDKRELKLRQSVVSMLYVTEGYAASETIEATERAAALAEESGNLKQLLNWAAARCTNALVSGDLAGAGALADRALDLAFREGSPTNSGSLYQLQTVIRHQRGELASVESHFTAGSRFFNDPRFRQFPGAAVIGFGVASWNAWMLGRAELAREREVNMMASTNHDNPYDLAYSGYLAARLRIHLREYEEAEALAARAVELADKHQLSYPAALCRVSLGHARAQLGRSAGIGMIRNGIAGFLAAGARLGITVFITYLASAQEREGAIDDALETTEQALQANPDELVYRPETLRIRGELHLAQGLSDIAEADFRESIALAGRMSAKAWELRTTVSLARLLLYQDRADEARLMLAEIYNMFTEGFDTADLKDAKALLDMLSA